MLIFLCWVWGLSAHTRFKDRTRVSGRRRTGWAGGQRGRGRSRAGDRRRGGGGRRGSRRAGGRSRGRGGGRGRSVRRRGSSAQVRVLGVVTAGARVRVGPGLGGLIGGDRDQAVGFVGGGALDLGDHFVEEHIGGRHPRQLAGGAGLGIAVVTRAGEDVNERRGLALDR